MSKYAAQGGLPSANNHKSPLGYRFKHNFMSWIEIDNGDPIAHLTTGQEILFETGFTVGNTTHHTAQPGYYYKLYKHNAGTYAGEWELRTPTGGVFPLRQ